MEPSIPTTPMPEPPPPPPPPAPKRKPPVLALLIGAVCILALAVAAIAAFSGDDDETSSPSPTTTEGDNDDPAPSTTRPRPTTTTTEPEPVLPTAADYSLTLVTTEQQCFGSAGCLVTVETELAIVGAAAADYGKPVSLTFQIDGDEDGPIINTIEVSANNQYRPVTEIVGTPNSGVVPTVTITMVR